MVKTIKTIILMEFCIWPPTATCTIQAGVGCHRDTEAQPPHPGLYGTGARYAPTGTLTVDTMATMVEERS